ncbi:hypothetical protein ACHAW5_009754 [Stephanodiscus triporus]|uniref:UDENN domain-containing protein n=1 Tax=Stephanodiscus triporus TaxID=2934178 RepID=A0ABD3QTC6_9STRA
MEHETPLSSMTIDELKFELMSLGDPSFVFDDRDELLSALKSARRVEEIKMSALLWDDPELSPAFKELIVDAAAPDDADERGGEKSVGTRATSSTSHDSSLSSGAPVVVVVPPAPPTVPAGSRKDDRDAAAVIVVDPPPAEDDDGGEGGESNSLSRRLVEYFVMVSCVPSRAGGGGDANNNNNNNNNATSSSSSSSAGRGRGRRPTGEGRPPDPTRDSMNPRTRGRFEIRRAHLPPPVAPPHRKKKSSGEEEEDDDDDDDGVADAYLEPRITARYPPRDHPDRPLNPRLPQFCHPEGTELIRPTSEYRMPRVHHFVLTDSMGGKLYGTALTVHEELLSERGGDDDDGEGGGGRRRDDASPKKGRTYYAPRVLTLLSTYPYLSAFRTYLTQLYRLATTTDVMTAPIERYVQNICSEVPAPPPGAFEVELSVHPSLGRVGEVRFWAPPADQPIPYVSLPFRVLFECLDVGNALFAWYSLACEGKVLLVSSQLSLLTVCGEILCSLLFPMRWSHLYIPVLPRSLCPMLDAPMPYLCGISRENFPYAVGDVSDETIVVDLDRNVVTVGPNAPDLPPLPNSRRKKLEGVLKENIGDVFWEARNLNRREVLRARASNDKEGLEEMLRDAHAVWEERMRTCDDAFNLAHAPDSVTLDFDEDANDRNAESTRQSRWDAVQEGFLRFYVASLQDYRRFLPAEELMGQRNSWRGGEGGPSSLRFRKEEFVAAADKDFQPFLEALVHTQQFDDFVTRKMHNAADAADIKFFDQSIDAKRNRSKLTLKKKETNFLHAASAHRDLKRIKAVEPSGEGLPPLPGGETRYMYKMWPVSFDERLFGTPRPIPSIISAEFDRRTALRAMLRSKYGDVEVHKSGGNNKSPEATAFILFFLTFTSIIGVELLVVEKKHGSGPDVDFDRLSLQSSPTRQMSELDNDMKVARTIAMAQIELTHRTLSLMRARKLPPEPLVYKLVIQACGRCKMTHVAPLLMEMIKRDGLATDSSIYTELIAAFSNDESQHSSLAYHMSSLSTERELLESSHLESTTSASEYSSVDLSTEASTHGVNSSAKTKKSRMSFLAGKAKKNLQTEAGPTPKFSMKVSSAVAKHNELGESLLQSLYPGIDIDTENPCPKCAAVLTEDSISAGWVPCATNDYQTNCSFCGHKFIPKFSVSCKSSSFQGSQGKGTPLYCDHLSPWVLVREIRSIMATTGGMGHILAEEFRSGTDISATLWWNMVVTFRRYKIPFMFLLQGSFHNNVILSLPVDKSLPRK